MTTITALPAAPSRADPANFAAKGDALLAALGTFVTETNTVAGEVNTNATTATTQAGTATTQAGIATTQAGIATTQAGNAATSASNAATSEGNAATSETNAEASRVAADKRYLGAKAVAPTLDNQGAALATGAVYYDSVTLKVMTWNGSAWAEGISAIAGVSSLNGLTGALTLAGITLTGNLTIYVTQTLTYTITNYNAFSTYSVAATAGSISRVGDTITYTAPATAQAVTLTVTMDGNATTFPLTILPAGVETPTNSTPTNGATDQNSSVTLTGSAFSWIGLSDTHASSDWQLATDSGFVTVVQSATADTANKTTWTVSGLSVSQTYYWRVRYTGAANGTSSWSTGTTFATKATFGGLIGTQGGQGFGVGEYPETLPAGFSAMTGTSDPASVNYGNYQFTDGSIMVFVPRFYYRIGNAASPRYATYGANAHDIVGIEAYATEALANAAGYAMHRAFKDGGADKSGFFVDKYLATNNGTTSCSSLADAHPISLTATAGYNSSSAMTGCTGILADAVVLSRARGAGVFNCISVFIQSALAMLSLAHAQAATATTYCAWYDAGGTTNFPKGCNNGALSDTNDATVTYAVSTTSPKPKTRATANFAKTTHNGQECGVADLNGSMYQVALGITDYGTSGTDSTAHGNGNAYVLKSSVALASLTGGWDGANDVWGNTTSLATKYDAVTGLMPWGATIGAVYFGNSTTQVFSGATSGTSWLRTACGIQETTSGTSVAGTSQFGNDQCYQYNIANLSVLCAGDWGGAAPAGVFFRYWSSYRSYTLVNSGFRSCAYGQ